MESQPQNPEFINNPEKINKVIRTKLINKFYMKIFEKARH